MNLSLLEDSKKVNLTANDLFDRIINLKIKVGKPAEGTKPAEIIDEFVIRSDYEVYYPASDSIFYDGKVTGSYIIRRCTMKPSIKVHCNMVTANVGTAVDIFISNFFIFSSDGKYLKNFTMKNYAVLEVELYMGYWGQFANTLNPNSPLSEYFNLKAQNGADKITLGSPVIVTSDKLPPDSVLHLHGFVADILTNPIALSDVTDSKKAEENPLMKTGDSLEDVLFNTITRRYLKHNNINKIKNTLSVKDTKPTKVPEIDKATGMIKDKEEAKAYGVRVYLSEGAKSIKYESKENSEGKLTDAITSFEAGNTIRDTVTRLLSFIDSRLNYRFTNNGDLIVFLSSEENDIDFLSKTFEETYKENNFAVHYDGKLPAVYNINIDGVTTITCPFYSFIEPFQPLQFASRYTLTSLVQYAVGYSTGFNNFIAIRASISFATVEPMNEVTITAIISNKKDNEG